MSEEEEFDKFLRGLKPDAYAWISFLRDADIIRLMNAWQQMPDKKVAAELFNGLYSSEPDE